MRYTASLLAIALLATDHLTAASPNRSLVKRSYAQARILGRAPQVSSTATDAGGADIIDTCDQEGASCSECFGPGFIECPGDSDVCYDPNDGGLTYCSAFGTTSINSISRTSVTTTQSLTVTTSIGTNQITSSRSVTTVPSTISSHTSTNSIRATTSGTSTTMTGTTTATTSTRTGGAFKLELPAGLLGGVALGAYALL